MPGGIDGLAQALNSGAVDTLIVLGGNPVYNAPADLNWATVQDKAKTVVRLAYYEGRIFSRKRAGICRSRIISNHGVMAGLLTEHWCPCNR